MGLGNAKPDTPKAHRCDRHFDRFAAVKVNGAGCCWQCYLEPSAYARRFPLDYYDQEPEAGSQKSEGRGQRMTIKN